MLLWIADSYVAEGVSPAVEPGILPNGMGREFFTRKNIARGAGRQDAALYGRRDACRYFNEGCPYFSRPVPGRDLPHLLHLRLVFFEFDPTLSS